MARPTLNLKINLENIHCHDEGDGWGNAEPYLWPVFFKIDGDSYVIGPGTGLVGFPVIESRFGDHGNLNDTSVDEGDNVSIPEALGSWENRLKPIPVLDETIRQLLGEDDIPGIAGVVVVLMEEDSWPNSLATTAYSALVNAVTLAVAQVAQGFQHALSVPTKEQIDQAIQTVKDTAARMVKDAVKGEMSGWQLIWYGTFGNNDDTIGSEAWVFTHQDFQASPSISFSRRWKSEGDWELNGTAIGVEPCPANAFADLFHSGSTASNDSPQEQKSAPEQRGVSQKILSAMYQFRAGEYNRLPGLSHYWTRLYTHTPDLIRTLARNEVAMEAAGRLFTSLPDVIASPDRPLPDQHLQDLETILKAMRGGKSSGGNSNGGKGNLSKINRYKGSSFWEDALLLLPGLQGKSFRQATAIVSRAGEEKLAKDKSGKQDPKTDRQSD
jgi:hypothetical protein